MQSIAGRFQILGLPVSCESYGSGHINRTYRLVTDQGRWYILQRINRGVFRDVPALMKNIGAVTRYLARREPDPRRVLTLVGTLEGGDYLRDEAGEYWRCYHFVRDSLSLDRPESPADLRASGRAFGRFQRQLKDFPAHTLAETIPDFHNTPRRFDQLDRAAAEDAMGRLKDVERELAFAMARRERGGALQRLRDKGLLPLRVTHNDTKLNNVLLDALSREPLCVIDLDTVMPGLVAHDFGDAIRFGASTGAEDERDLSQVSLSLALFEAFAGGFLSECGSALTPEEADSLAEGAYAMTLECGIRFLADHLAGDTYFRLHRPGQNLDRCRTQFRLVEDMERNWDAMQDTLHALLRQGADAPRI